MILSLLDSLARWTLAIHVTASWASSLVQMATT